MKMTMEFQEYIEEQFQKHTLVAWEIWKHRKPCVFEGVSPNVQVVLPEVSTESRI